MNAGRLWYNAGRMAEKQNPLSKALSRMRAGNAGGQSADEMRAEIVRLKRAVDELTILSDLAFAMGASADPEEIKEKLVKRLMKAVNAEQATVTLLDREGEQSMQTNIRIRTSSIQQSSYSLNDMVVGWMHLHKKPLVSNDPHRDDRFKGIGWDPNIRSVACVPLMIKSELIGILSVFNKRDDEGFTPDNERLLMIIAGQSAQVIENARLYTESLLLARMQDEERHASNIQRMMMPDAPEVDGYEIAGRSVPARTMGGDYYDFIPAGEGRWAISLGDVSGKGLPAALLMANTHATIRAQTHTGARVDDRIAAANRMLCASTDDEKFVTLFYAELDAVSHRLTYCNAGHEPPFLAVGTGETRQLDPGGVALGVMETIQYERNEIELGAGAVFVIYSDGVTDATNAGNEAFGVARLVATIEASRSGSAVEIVDAIVAAVDAHAGGEPQFDDVTVVVLKRSPA